MPLKKPLILLGLGLSLSGLILALAVYGTPFLHLVELKARDAFFLARGPLPMTHSRVAVVAVGERSLDRQGRWPWPREKVAALIQAVAQHQAQAIGLDMGFFEPDDRFPAEAVGAILEAARQGRPLSDEQVLRRFHPDLILARVLAQLKGRVVMGYFFHMAREGMAHLGPQQIDERLRLLDPYAYPAARLRSPQARQASLLTALAPETVQPVLLRAAGAAGYFNVLPDRDGAMRSLPLVIKCGQRLFPPLALATLAAYLRAPLPVVDLYADGLRQISLGGRRIPVDPEGRMLINLRGGPGAVRLVEATDLMEGRLAPDVLKGQAVLVGVTALGLFDLKSTAYAPQQPAVEVAAQAMDNILTGDFLAKPAWGGLFALGAILGLGLAATLFMGLLRPLWGGLASLGLGAGYVLLTYALFLGGYVVQVVHPLLALLAAGSGVGLYRNLTEEKEKRWLRSAFAHYLNPVVIDRLTQDPSQLQMAGEKKDLTVLFSDIRSFITHSEGMEPEKLARQLNIYLERMTQEVFAQEGVLDKFIGDAVMAFFGAPEEQPDHAARACRTALGMLRATVELDATWKEMGLPPLRIGVGINTGPMIVGNLGSELRMDYTVVGDAVNLASRLEDLTRSVGGVDIIVGQATRDACADQFLFRPLAMVQVKGKRQWVEVYQLLGTKDAPRPPQLKLAEEAFDLLRRRELAASLARYQELLGRFPDDQPAAWAVEQLGRLMQDPPPEWGPAGRD
ncbi:MAG: adenylate/guanylate cyclase domain-containing protein [Thermodesulfobacteriota bacterium]